jgi:hypothetical protein
VNVGNLEHGNIFAEVMKMNELESFHSRKFRIEINTIYN